MSWARRSIAVAMTMMIAAGIACESGNAAGGQTAARSGPGSYVLACLPPGGARTTIPPVPPKDRVRVSPTRYAPVRSLSQLPPRSTNIARVLARVEAGLDPTAHLCAAITAHGPLDDVPGPWMTASVHVASRRSTDAEMYGEWQIALLAGASAELFNVSGQSNLENVLSGVSARAFPSRGAVFDLQLSTLGAVAAGQQFLSNRLSDKQTVVDVHRAVEASGATVVSMHVWHPLDKAVAVTIRIKNLNAFRRTGWNTLSRSMLLSAAEFEGLYLAVDAPDGTPLAGFSQSFRFGVGSQWESPDAGFGYAHG